ncbi:MAG: Rpn family recombination-promoting nuclease/putative transposase [Odoribacter sp.]|nr:Rpn family recombination-promoting nuclease/putative transposase [Odoribacter sp.]
MGKKDHVEKLLEDYNDVFADIYNVLLFRKPYLKEDLLHLGPTESIYKDDSDKTYEQRRDVLKFYQNKVNLVISSFGIENQSAYDKNMPIRIMSYDASTYKQQINNNPKNQNIYPVITIVLNFSGERWGESTDLHSLLKIPEELKPYVKNYEITVFDIAFLDDEVINSFTSDFKAIARFFKDKRLSKNALDDNTVELKYPAAVAEFLTVFTKDNRYADVSDIIMRSQKKGECVTMCNIAQAIEEKGIKQGVEQGIEKGKFDAVKNIINNLNLSLEDALKAVGIPDNEKAKYAAMLQTK